MELVIEEKPLASSQPRKRYRRPPWSELTAGRISRETPVLRLGWGGVAGQSESEEQALASLRAGAYSLIAASRLCR